MPCCQYRCRCKPCCASIASEASDHCISAARTALVESRGHELIVTTSRYGSDSELEKTSGDAEVVISQPLSPACLTADRNATVAEATYPNSTWVAEHVVVMIPGPLRNYIPSRNGVIRSGRNIADCVARSNGHQGMPVGRYRRADRPARSAADEAFRRASALHGPTVRPVSGLVRWCRSAHVANLAPWICVMNPISGFAQQSP